MAIVFSDTFTVSSDVGIAAYPTTPDWAYNLGSGTNLSVNAANDRVQSTVINNNFIARIINAAAPTGDQQIIATVGIDVTNRSRGQLAVRCKSDGTANFYLASLDIPAALMRIYRCDNGSFGSGLANSSAITFTNGAHTLSFKAVTNGSQVDLTLDYDSGATILTYSDTDVNRKLTGTPGIAFYQEASSTSGYIDNVSVDNLAAAGGILRQSKMDGNFQDLANSA